MAHDALGIANKLLDRAAMDDGGELISNLKLQKMLYYLQGYHLAFFNAPLFSDDIEAWFYGPVVPSVYRKYKKYANKGIPPNKDEDVIALNQEQEDMFEQVYSIYGSYSALGLMNMTHKETPWQQTETGAGNVITHARMKSFFKHKIK